MYPSFPGRSPTNLRSSLSAPELLAHLNRTFSSRAYQLGEDCVRGGGVLSVEKAGPDRFSGQVTGRRGNIYSVDVEILHSEGVAWIDGDCTCSQGGDCQHVVALLLKALQDSVDHGGSQLPSRDPTSRKITQWLDRWPSETDAEEPVPPAHGDVLVRSRAHLFYVVGIDGQRQAEIKVHKAYIKKDGTLGSNIRNFNIQGDWRYKYLNMEDAAIIAKLNYFRDSLHRDPQAPPGGEDPIALVRDIAATGRGRAGDIRGPVLAWAQPRKCGFAWSMGTDGSQQPKAQDENGSAVTILPFPTPLFLDPKTGEAGVAETELGSRLTSWLAAAPPIPPQKIKAVEHQLSRIDRQARVPRPSSITLKKDVQPTPVLMLYGEATAFPYSTTTRSGDHNLQDMDQVYPCVRMEVTYGSPDARVHPDSDENIIASSDRGLAIIQRDRTKEANFLRSLRDRASEYINLSLSDLAIKDLSGQHLGDPADVVFPWSYRRDWSSEAAVEFMMEEVPEFEEEGWKIEIDSSWPVVVRDGPVTFSTTLNTSDTDWFSVGLSLEIDGMSLDISNFLGQLIKTLPVDETGQLEEGFREAIDMSGFQFRVPLKDGSWTSVDGTYFAEFAEAFLEAQGLLGFHRAEAGRLFQLAEALEGCGAPWKGGRELLELGKRLQVLSSAPEVPPPAQLHGELRPYQCAGYGWLKALSDSGLGGVLADDMGLGKTVQTLALLAHRHLVEKTGHPSLLVVPTSLVGNWKREAARFTPDLKLLVLHGPHRHGQFSEISRHHLIITTYPLLRRDHETLFAHEYDTAVLDEAQAVKNPTAAVSKHIRDIRARHRLALTGTPLENNLQELWSLYDWLIPGMLGNRKAFTKSYRTPIEKQDNRQKQHELSTRVKPFLMRRTKEHVAKELPEKTIIDELIPLSGAQAGLYESIRTAMDVRVRDAIARRGLAASRITVLDALLKLRQVCCDPGLVKLEAARKVSDSAKRARLLELLEELVAEGRKVLVFSQFVKMLKLIERDVADRGWGYSMLHGSTRDRDSQVAAFQSGDLPVFLVSLKAGGTGLNLTAADTVILYDPWWNPATERQAMDRAHRIGQDKPVFVHRLIAEHTVEAAIQKMQARKQALADALFEGSGQGPLSLTEEDVQALFRSG